jgi:hypothetical protein
MAALVLLGLQLLERLGRAHQRALHRKKGSFGIVLGAGDASLLYLALPWRGNQ